MEIINSLKSRIGEAEEEKICQFLGESKDSIEQSLDYTLNGMLGGLREIAQKEGDASSIMKVINDGGHSGDLTDNLLGLFGNGDKMKLLITIGKNINSHFFGDNVDQLVEKISNLGGMAKGSAGSLFSLAAPLVLGVLGKNIKLENLDKDQFTSSLLNEKMTLEPETSASLMSALGFSGINAPSTISSTESISEPELENQYDRRENSDDKWNWMAWVLLALLGLAVAYYTFKDKYLEAPAVPDTVTSISDSSDNNTIDDNIFEELDTDRNKNNTGNTAVLNKEEDGSSEEKVATEEKTAPVSQKSEAAQNTKPTSNNSEAVRSQTVRKDTRSMVAKLSSPRSFFSINGISFKRNSAEISSQGSLDELINFMYNNGDKSIEIAGTGSSSMIAEDRAYSVREKLYQAGIDISRLKVRSGSVKGDGPVMIKVK